LYPAFNCGDGIHPSPSGYFAMGTAVDLSLFSKK
jgi:lysophospholipase L1-like esterase